MNTPTSQDTSFSLQRLRLLLGATLVLSLLFVAACDDDDPNPVAEVTPQPTPPVALPAPPPTQAYLDRQVEYLDFCFNECESDCGIRGVICRVAKGSSSYNREAITNSLNKLDERRDTSDFDAASLVRIIYLDDETGALLPEDRQNIEAALLDFTWWNDQPRPGAMVFGTENHQALFHSSEYLVGQRWPDRVSTNSGMTGEEHMEAVRWKLMRWLDFRGKYGFTEFHSNVYFNETMPAMINLAEFAEDPEIQERAAIVVDILGLDIMTHNYKGLFATSHGRTYPSRKANGLEDSTEHGTWVMLGLGEYRSRDDFIATFLSTSQNYYPFPILENLANEITGNLTSGSFEARQRDSWNIDDGPELGVGYINHDDVMFWQSMTAFLSPKLLNGFVNSAELYDLWDNAPWSDFPQEAQDLLIPLMNTGLLEAVSDFARPATMGLVLEETSTYTYRTPHYQLSGAQDYQKGWWSGQKHIWQATLDRDAYTFVVSRGEFQIDISYSPDFASDWTGGWMPKAAMHKNVGVFMYDAADNPVLNELMRRDSTHAYWNRDAFDENIDGPNWIIGRKGDAYMALWSATETTWSTDPDFQHARIADGHANTWIVELGSAEEHGSFQSFVSQIQAAQVQADENGVVYDSPSLGLVEASWDGPMTVRGRNIDLGPYERFDNPNVKQTHGESELVVTSGGERMILDIVERRREMVPVE